MNCLLVNIGVFSVPYSGYKSNLFQKLQDNLT